MTRAGRMFWLLVLVATLAAGALSHAVAWRPGPATGVVVAVSGLVLVAAGALALRILVRVDRARG